MSHQKRKSMAPFSLLEGVLIISITALAIATILPSVRLTREAIAVERAARCLEKSETAIKFILAIDPTVTNRLEISLDMIENAFANTNLSSRISPPAWPPEAVLESFNPGNNGSPTINVRLKTGETKISSDDIAMPRTPQKQTAPPAVRSLL